MTSNVQSPHLSPVKIRDMRIGCARVSAEDQTLDLQKDALECAKCREVYEDQATGKNTACPHLEACLKSLREGDTLAGSLARCSVWYQ